MKILFYDCFAGISGDMNLSALVDLLGDDGELKELIERIFNGQVLIDFSNVKKSGISCKKLNVIEKHSPKRYVHLKEIENIIENSDLSNFVREKSISVLKKIAIAEAKIHNVLPEEIHFHEIGAVDTIVDVVGGMWAIEKLGVDRIYSSVVEVGYGYINIAHGRFPVPAPATAEILKGVPIRQSVESEATTPTGAALITTLADGFAFPENFVIEKIGYGAGERDTEVPNCLRLFLGHISGQQIQEEDELLIEVNLDDMLPEKVEFVMDKLLSAGALDVFITPIIMKKSRPAFMLSILCEIKNEKLMESIIFEETTTFGLRKIKVKKNMLKRKIETIKTPLGDVRIKTGYLGEKVIKRKFEYEDIRRIADDKNLSFEEVLKIIQSHCI